MISDLKKHNTSSSSSSMVNMKADGFKTSFTDPSATKDNAHKRYFEICPEIIFLVCFYLNAEDLCYCCLVCKSWHTICAVKHQAIWQELVLKKFGFKYENYVLYTGQTDWRLIYAKAATFVRNIKTGNPQTTKYKHLLANKSSSYEGSLAMTADCKLLFWENGEVIQCVDINEGKELYRIPVSGVRNRQSKPCLVNTKSKIFLHLNREILVFDITDGKFLMKLNISDDNWEPNDFSLDVSVRNQQLTFLTLSSLYVFDCETMKLLYKVVHRERNANVDTCQDIDFLWAGYRCVSGVSEESCHSCTNEGIQVTKCRHKSKHIVTWLRKRSSVIKIFDMRDGKEIRELRGHENKILRARQAQNLYSLEHYYLASLDTGGIIRIWDSGSSSFDCLQIVSTGWASTFRLSFTSTHLMIMSEVRPIRSVIIKIWEFNPLTLKNENGLDSSGKKKNRYNKKEDCYVGLTSGRYFLQDKSHFRNKNYNILNVERQNQKIKSLQNKNDILEHCNSIDDTSRLCTAYNNSDVQINVSVSSLLHAPRENCIAPSDTDKDSFRYDSSIVSVDPLDPEPEVPTCILNLQNNCFPADFNRWEDNDIQTESNSGESSAFNNYCHDFGHLSESTDSEVGKFNESSFLKLNSGILREADTYVMSGPSYFTDFIDNQLIGVWQSAIRPEPSFPAAMSNWEVYDCLKSTPLTNKSTSIYLKSKQIHSDNSNADDALKLFPNAYPLKGSHTWNMEARGNIWTLLDWKCLSIKPNGDVDVFDFCPLSQKSPRRYLG